MLYATLCDKIWKLTCISDNSFHLWVAGEYFSTNKVDINFLFMKNSKEAV